MTNAKMAEEQRHELAEQLDKDLDAWLAAHEKKPYTEGWNEDNWEEVRFDRY